MTALSIMSSLTVTAGFYPPESKTGYERWLARVRGSQRRFTFAGYIKFGIAITFVKLCGIILEHGF